MKHFVLGRLLGKETFFRSALFRSGDFRSQPRSRVARFDGENEIRTQPLVHRCRRLRLRVQSVFRRGHLHRETGTQVDDAGRRIRGRRQRSFVYDQPSVPRPLSFNIRHGRGVRHRDGVHPRRGRDPPDSVQQATLRGQRQDDLGPVGVGLVPPSLQRLRAPRRESTFSASGNQHNIRETKSKLGRTLKLWKEMDNSIIDHCSRRI